MKLSVATVGRSLRYGAYAVIALASLIAGAEAQTQQQTIPGLGRITVQPGEGFLISPQTGRNGGTGNNALDAARNGGLDALTGGQQARPEQTAPGQGPNAPFTDQQRVIAQRYCENRLRPEERELLLMLPNFSQIERDYCRRVGDTIRAFGYDTFESTRATDSLRNGAIPDTYRLGIGDELVVTFRGQLSSTSRPIVDREGRVMLENLPPLPAAGRTFGDFRRELQARVQTAFIGTEAFVSLGSVRQVAVSVVGEVFVPGVHQLTGLSTVVDALAMAGGIKKTGSLRNVLIERNGQLQRLDLYDVIMGAGAGRDFGIAEGDRIVVTTTGPTVAVAGKVKRPAIYELPPGAAGITVRDALSFAGGALRSQGIRTLIRTFDASGREIVREATSPTETVGDADVVMIEYPEDIQVGTVRVDGAVRLAGNRVRTNASSVRGLLSGVDSLAQGAYLPFAVLETVEPATQARRYFPVNLQRILSGEQDYVLTDRDRLLVLSQEDIRFLTSERVQRVIRPTRLERGLQEVVPPEPGRGLAATNRAQTNGTTPTAQELQNDPEALTAFLERQRQLQQLAALTTPAQAEGPVEDQCQGIDALQAIVDRTRSSRFSSAVQAVDVATPAPTTAGRRNARPVPCPVLFNENPDLLPFVLEHVVAINGEVRLPGAYPITQGTPIGAVVAVAGGVTLDADLSRVEFTRTDVVARAGVTNTTGVTNTSRALADLSGPQGAGIVVNPGDIVRFNAVYSDLDSGPILLVGEFIRPGYYDIRRGERISEVIARAGGLTSQAYPYGAVFTRERAKRSEQEGLNRASRDLNAAMVTAMSRGDLQGNALSALQQLSRQLSATEAVGRVVIEADPTVLQVRPELDVVLEPGDVLYMPKRPSSILVNGDVLNPGALQYVAGTSVEAYLRQAGGLQRSADRNRIFVLYPNGVAQPITNSVWTYTASVQVPPGSAIVAPKDPTPFGIATVRDITTLIGQIALTAASIAVIAR